MDAGWSNLVARRAHNPKVAGSNTAIDTNKINWLQCLAVAPWYLSLPTIPPKQNEFRPVLQG